MASESCIVYPAGSYYIVVRNPLISICKIAVIYEGEDKIAPDPQAAAVILNQFIYWTNSKLDDKHQSRYRRAAAASENSESDHDDSLWIYKDYDELKTDLLDLFGRNKIIDNVQWLVLSGYLKRRNNPRYRWDKTLQYAVDIDLVQSQIDALPSFKNKLSKVSNQTIESGKTKRAIPKKTTEKTEEKKEKDSPAAFAAVPDPTDSFDDENDASLFDDTGESFSVKDTENPLVQIIVETGHKNVTENAFPPAPFSPAEDAVPVKPRKAKSAKITTVTDMPITDNSTPAPKKPSLLAVIAHNWNKNEGFAKSLIGQLLGTAKDGARGKFKITPGMTGEEIMAYGYWFRYHNPRAAGLPPKAEWLKESVEEFRAESDYADHMARGADDLARFMAPADDTPAEPAEERIILPLAEVEAYMQSLYARMSPRTHNSSEVKS